MKAQMQLKSIIIIIVIAILSSTLIANICFAQNTGTITEETVKLRREASTNSDVLELISSGTEVEILGNENGWTKIKHNDFTGYVRSDLIKTAGATTASSNDNKKNIVEDNSVATEKQNDVTENSTTAENQNETIESSADVETKNVTIGKNIVQEKVTSKIIPLINALDSGTIEANSEVDVIEIINNWAKIKTADNKEGWIVTEKLSNSQTSDNNSKANDEEQAQNQNSQEQAETSTDVNSEQSSKTMYVNAQTVNVREQASSSSKVLVQLSINTEVSVISTEGDWSKIDSNGTTGYILSSLLSDSKSATTSRSSMNERETNKENTASGTTDTSTSSSVNTTSSTTTAMQQATTTSGSTGTTATISGDAIVAYAKQYLGCKYIMGGTSPSGFDCSGFTQYVYKHFGISINRTAAAQYSNGKQVTDLQAGDLVMFGPSGISHVGIYIGGGTFIHAANPSRGVTTDTLLSGYYKTHYVGARRIL